MSSAGLSTSVENGKRSFWSWIVGGILLVPVLYVVSFGPACWLCTREAFSVHVITRAYQPILQLAMRGPDSLRRITMGYASLGACRNCRIGIGLTRVYSDYEATFHVDRPASHRAGPTPL